MVSIDRTQVSPGDGTSLNLATLANLDIVRALAVLFVFVSHVPTWKTHALSSGFYMGMVGSLGVSIFFVHTSLVLMASLDRLGRSSEKAGTFGAFMIRRVFRIYPLSIFALLSVEALAAAGAWESVGIAAFVANFFLVQNLTRLPSAPATMWSLPYEIQMYLALPFFYDFARGVRNAPRWLFAGWAAVVTFCLLLTLPTSWVTHSLFQRARFAAHFIPGVLAFSVFCSQTSRGSSARGRAPWWLLPVLLCGCALTVPWITTDAEPGATIAQWLVCLALGLLIPRCEESPWSRLNVIAGLIAKYSYGIYLTHFPLVDLIYASWSPVPAWARFFVLVGATLGLSVGLYHFVEEPFIARGRSIAERWRSRYAAVPVLRAERTT